MSDTIVIDNKEYKLVSDTNSKGVDYIYVAEMEDNDITGNFYVYKKNIEINSYEKVTEPEELKKVLLLLTANII